MMVAVWPPGPTSSMSTSSGHVWSKLLSVTFTSTTVPLRPETVMSDGYGVAGPTLGMKWMIGLQNALPAQPVLPAIGAESYVLVWTGSGVDLAPSMDAGSEAAVKRTPADAVPPEKGSVATNAPSTNRERTANRPPRLRILAILNIASPIRLVCLARNVLPRENGVTLETGTESEVIQGGQLRH